MATGVVQFIKQNRLAIALLLVDSVCIVVSFSVAHFLRVGYWPIEVVGWPTIFSASLMTLVFYVLELYRPAPETFGISMLAKTLTAIAAGGVVIALFIYVSGQWGRETVFSRGIYPVALILFTPCAVVSRFYVQRFVSRKSRSTRWLVIGAGERAKRLYDDYLASKGGGEVDFLAIDHAEIVSPGLPRVIGAISDTDLHERNQYTGVIIAIEPPMPDHLVQVLMRRRLAGLRIYDLADFYESFWFKVPVLHLRTGWFVFSHGFELLHNRTGLLIKRIIDVILALVLLAVLWPVMLVTALAIRLDSPGPAIYRQKRKGENGKPFVVYKFRSMYTDAERNGARWTVINDPRITRVGRVIRQYRLDELPQLVNIVRGEMSFIGPRPEAIELSEMYEKELPFYDLRYLVKPGLSGWAQVLYPYGSSVEDAREKLQYDLYYIKNYSLLLDLAIVLKTTRVLILGRGR